MLSKQIQDREFWKYCRENLPGNKSIDSIKNKFQKLLSYFGFSVFRNNSKEK